MTGVTGMPEQDDDSEREFDLRWADKAEHKEPSARARMLAARWKENPPEPLPFRADPESVGPRRLVVAVDGHRARERGGDHPAAGVRELPGALLAMREDIRGGGVAARRLAEGATLRDVLDAGAPREWLGLDAGVRSWLPYPLLPTRAEIEGRRSWPGSLRRPGPLTESRLALALCHPDGRIREAALGAAAEHPELLPLVVVRSRRLGPPVRERARNGAAHGSSTWTPPWGSRR